MDFLRQSRCTTTISTAVDLASPSSALARRVKAIRA